ncbi:MAG: hypothetical protein L5656_10335 [Thermanaeromonas sp.]|uniref:hypothetical protein n=1 Tax=Thermanaeromonas sp. TaxID=2003697 RepID=UPI00243F1334|nr:hypothetical protein [Thermanaeromonas sp.]MCG0278902.1 hypothetical protein [Thermanaeromonas sp.]
MPVTVVLKAMGTQSQALQDLMDGLGVALKERGFQVLALPVRSSDGKLFRMWQAGLLLAVAEWPAEKVYPEPTLRFFYSFRKAEKSLRFIATVVQEILINRDGLNYTLARKWEHIIRPAYFRFLQDSDVPAVLLELHGIGEHEELRKRIQTRIVEGVERYFTLDDNSKLSTSEVSSVEKNISPTSMDYVTEDFGEVEEADQIEQVEEVEEAEEEVQQESVGCLLETKSIEKAPEEEIGKIDPNREKEHLNVLMTEARLGRRPRHWGSNPLAPPGDGPIYYFEPPMPAELPPAIPSDIISPTVYTTDSLTNLRQLSLSLNRITRDDNMQLK